MIPRVCANCQHCLLVADGGQVLFGQCIARAQRVNIQDPREYTCTVDFTMMDNPNYVLPDEAQETASDDQ